MNKELHLYFSNLHVYLVAHTNNMSTLSNATLIVYLHQLQARTEIQSCSSNSGPGTPSSPEDTASLAL